MITAGIIAEYNPFHQGHSYHIKETRRRTGADYIVVVMSGNFVQRGEPAITDKYFRTEMALKGGADLVLELPAAYAAASAEYFASAAVGMLHNLNCVDILSFGSEWAEVKDYEPLVKILTEETPEFQKRLREELKSGKNFPVARRESLEAILEEKMSGAGTARNLLREPNHILGLEYMKSLRRLRSKIRPFALRREGAGYHDEDICQPYPSASAIRKELLSGTPQWEKIQRSLGSMPAEFADHFQSGNFVQWKDMMPYLDYVLLMERGELTKNFGVDADMEARLNKYGAPGLSFEKLLERLHTKRLTDAAWRRALLHIVLHIKKNAFLERASSVPVPYARVLGFSKNAPPLMKKIRENASVPLIQKTGQGKIILKDKTARTLFLEDIRTAQFYEQIAAKKSARQPVSEWRRQQIII